MSLVPPDPELNPIESALGRLAPVRSRIDRDRLMFQAGVNSAQAQSPRRWVWPAIAASLAVVALSESAALAVRREPRVLVVQQPAPAVKDLPVGPEPVRILVQAPPTPFQQQEPWLSAGSGALSLRRQALRFGIEGLPDVPPMLSQTDGAASDRGAGSETHGLIRRYELNKVLALGGPS
jgi:hypothetical protein